MMLSNQVRFYEVSEAELEDMRSKFTGGRFDITIENTSFSLEEYQRSVAGLLDEEVTALKVITMQADVQDSPA
jgi:hypothetical protein